MGKARNPGEYRRRPAGGGGAVTSSPSPSSSSSSDFEFTVSLSPACKHSAALDLCPADELFYKGQLLPLQLSPRLSLVRSLLLSSSTTSSDAAVSRDSTGSSSSCFSGDGALPHCDSSHASFSADEETGRRLPSSGSKRRYLSSLISSVFLHRGSKKDKTAPAASATSSAKEKIKKYVKKVKPLYEKFYSLQQKQSNPHRRRESQKKNFSFSIRKERESTASSFMSSASGKRDDGPCCAAANSPANSFSGDLRYPLGKQCAASCPSSMRSSPSHSGILHGRAGCGGCCQDDPSSSSMEELQNAVQGAIAHCKSTMIIASKKKAMGSVNYSGDDDLICAA
ncbi:putative membrane-associated kinase regulator 1 [Apostasia shenzhenica]|uniref:Putative membrane-associated kinase regulator 1 n=1 Tax=Apostasia shenzhenica TaxID=1088818 RepID=A0A2I0B4A9_9ASPA|nr:putative membrane-associated kinase regulator 1 [Apostasia shenzhenica]